MSLICSTLSVAGVGAFVMFVDVGGGSDTDDIVDVFICGVAVVVVVEVGGANDVAEVMFIDLDPFPSFEEER